MEGKGRGAEPPQLNRLEASAPADTWPTTLPKSNFSGPAGTARRPHTGGCRKGGRASALPGVPVPARIKRSSSLSDGSTMGKDRTPEQRSARITRKSWPGATASVPTSGKGWGWHTG